MKKFKKLVLPLSLVGMLALGSTSVFASQFNKSSDVSRTTTHHSQGTPISGIGFFNDQFTVSCGTNSDLHNKATVHYYNNTSEPVFLYIDSEPRVRVEPWSGQSKTISVQHGDTVYVEVRGYDSSNQVLDGDLYYKSFRE